MFIVVACECEGKFETPEANAGRLAGCPHCGRVLTVPKPAMTSDEPSIDWQPEPPRTSGKAVASLVLGLSFFLAFLTGLPAILLGRRALRDIWLSEGRLKGQGIAVAGIILGVIGCLLTVLLMPAYRSNEAARHSQCTNNLYQIGLAMKNYQLSNGCFPPAAIADKNGRPLLSWRVAILPYLEMSSLYAKFHLDEPWDSPHNLTLLPLMPYSYGCPSDTTRERETTDYQVVIGPETAFTPNFESLRIDDFGDGLYNTLLVGETRRCVPWTKPEDLPVDTNLPLNGLGSYHGYPDNGFHILTADGVVHFVTNASARKVLATLLTRDRND